MPGEILFIGSGDSFIRAGKILKMDKKYACVCECKNPIRLHKPETEGYVCSWCYSTVKKMEVVDR